MGIVKDVTPKRDLTDQELRQYDIVHEEVSQLDTSDTFDSSDPNQRLFFFSFDGTRNDRDSTDPDTVYTNPAILQSLVPRSDNVGSEYIRGVATQTTNVIDEAYKSATGDECEQRAEDAYTLFCEKVKIWQDENPNVEVHLSTAGFSRGTASQRHFANLIQQRGCPDPDGEGYLIPPGGVHQDIMLMYDSVVTYEENLLLAIPPNVTALHFTAEHENRTSFDLASITDPLFPNDPGTFEIWLPGSHCDVGGGWDYDGLSARSLALGHQALELMGVPVKDIPEGNTPSPENITIHDSGVMFELDTLEEMIFNLGNMEFGEREEFVPGNPERFAQLPSEVQEAALKRAEIEHQKEVELATDIRQADLKVMGSQNEFEDAIDSGDGISIAQTGIDYYSALDDRSDLNEDNYNEQTEAALDIVSSGIGLGQSIDSGDEWGIAEESLNLLKDIDNYLLQNNGQVSVPLSETSKVLGLGAAGINFGRAIDSGDDMSIIQSSADLLEGIDNYCQGGTAAGTAFDEAIGVEAGNTGAAFKGIASAAGLAMNIASMDDVFESGDAGDIAYLAASTTHNAINTYNAVAQFSSLSQTTGNWVPGLGFVAAGVLLAQGDVVGAAFSAASAGVAMAVAAGLMTTGVGAVVGLAIMAVSMLISDDDPPEATASFTLDENGNVVMDVGGDSEMQDSAQAQGSALLKVMQDYKNGGGRLLIDGHLPSFTVTQGEGSSLNYHSETGGKAAVRFDDSVSQTIQLRGVLLARDRGERLDSAVKVATNSSGDIDVSQIDQIMAGHGFVKKGITYTYGETTERHGTTFGSGVMVGGGNVGPEGQHFTAKSSDFKSLPLRTSPLPSQQLGEINRVVSLKNVFSGVGAELLAMALTVPGGLLALASEVEGAETTITETDSDYIKPLDAVELATYLRSIEDVAQPANGAGEEMEQLPLPAIDSPEQMQEFLSDHWSDLLMDNSIIPGFHPDSAYHYRESLSYNGLFTDGSTIPLALWDDDGDDDDDLDGIGSLQDTEVGNTQSVDIAAESFTGRRLTGDEIPEELAGIQEGAVFLMAEDSILRFLPSELYENSGTSNYSLFEETYIFVGFGTANNGRVWQDDNGDLRFEPLPGFVGTSSFSYTLKTPDGQLVEQVATVVVKNVNDAPQLTDDSYTLIEGEALYLDRLLNNDSDPEGDTLEFDHFHGLEHGSLSLIGGRLAFVPEEGYFGDVAFSYWVRDHATSYPVMAQVNIHYVDSNTGAQTGDDHFIILEENSLTTSKDKLLSNDVEHDGEAIVFTGLGAAVHGVVTEAADGSIVFTPEPDYTGDQAGFYYNVEDASGNSSTGWAGVDVLDVREAPVVVSSSHVAIAEDEILPFTSEEIATFVYDPDGDDLHFDFITNVTGGTISFTGGIYVFIPDADYSGRASFDCQANDNHRGVVSGHLEFDITPVNDAIDTGSDRLTTLEEQAVTTTVTDLTANDTDVDGAVIDFVSLGAARNGLVTMDGAGNITFTPDSDYAGSDAGFEYIVKDSEGLESTGWVEVEVTGVNDTPLVAKTQLTVNEDIVLTFDQDLLKTLFTDVDGDVLSITAIQALEGGSIHEESGVYSFRPDGNYNGDGQIRLTVTDNMGAVAESTVSLDIFAVDDLAEMGLDTLTTTEEQAVTVTVAELLAAGTDVDGALTFAGLGDTEHGTVSLSSSGEITFVPDPDYYGNEAGFSYRVLDEKGGETTATVTVEVTGVNDPPTIILGSIEASEDTPIIFTQETITKFISDLDGDTIVLTDLQPAGGTVSQSGEIYTFTPQANYHGRAILSYTATDMNGGTVSGNLDLDILSMDDPTSFGADVFTTQEEQALITSVSELMANDADVDGSGELQFKDLGGASHGQVQLGADGSVTFTPEENYFGEDAGFAYILSDSEGHEAAGWVSVKLSAVNDKPEITGNRIVIQENESLTFNQEELSKFIFDPDGDLLSLDVVTNVEGGRMELSGGVYTFIPDADFYGEASLEYLATDSEGVEAPGTLYIGVKPVNDLPTVSYSSGSGFEDNEILFNIADLMSGATDVEDGTNLRFDGIDSSLNGDVYVDSDNIAHFVPHKDYFGSGFFRYKVLDSEGGIGLGYVGVDITGVNDVPVALDDEKILAWSNNSYENVFLAATFLDNDYDVDGDTLSITSVSGAEFGTVSVDAAGNIHYIAGSDNWVGVDSFTYILSDGQGAASQAVAEIDVKLNTSPDVYSEIIETQEDFISYISQAELLANDSDINGDTMYITGVDQAEHCNVELIADGRIRFTPELNYNNLHPGQASFRYTVTDGISDPVTAVALFDIDPVNDAPILVAERITGAVEDNSFSFLTTDLLSNDSDVEMDSPYETDSISFDTAWGAHNGTLSYNEADGKIYYNPNQNFNGVETFSYRVVDSHGAATTIQSEIYVTPVNDKPFAESKIGDPAEEVIDNYYSFSSLLTNAYDVDGDSLSITNVHKISGKANVTTSGQNILVIPEEGAKSVVVGYTVSDGHGGETDSTLTIPTILEHNYAPTFSGVYSIGWKNSYTVWFNFHAEDKNGGNSWGNYGDIASISASAPNTGSVTQDGSNIGTGTFKFKGDVDNAALTLTVADQAGATGTIRVTLSHLNKIDGTYHYSPVVLDLDGDGVELIDVAAGVTFDWNLDGTAEKTGWVGQDDGFLVYDYDKDQAVHYANELALKEYKPGANTDLEGLQVFDTNEDGVFDQQDDEWNVFGIWQDKNSNGETDAGEFLIMDETDITSIELQSDEEYREESGNVIYGETTFHREDGSEGDVGDVGLTGETIEFTQVDNILDEETPYESDSEDTKEQTSSTDLTTSEATPLQTDESVDITQNSITENTEPNNVESSSDSVPLDETELNRQLSQLLSDMASSTPANGTEDIVFIEPANDVDYVDVTGDVDQDALMIA
ncbi:tandem-95 repeat protein [Desulforhopalus sp. 52FAK]